MTHLARTDQMLSFGQDCSPGEGATGCETLSAWLRGAAHRAAGAVAAALEVVQIALAANDVAARAHAAGNDAQLSGPRAYRTLAGDVDKVTYRAP